MENPKLNEFYNGLHSAEKMSKLREGLAAIETNNTNYFESRKTNSGDSDCLSDHYVLLQNSDAIIFGFIENTDIPENIKAESIELFNAIFNSDSASPI